MTVATAIVFGVLGGMFGAAVSVMVIYRYEQWRMYRMGKKLYPERYP